ncbi:MAG: hypothetical protein ACREJM_10170, partial [Candidatus Saccharimonadales bacterium]
MFAVAGAEAGRVRHHNREYSLPASDAPLAILPGHRRGGALTLDAREEGGSAPATSLHLVGKTAGACRFVFLGPM